MSNFMEKLNPAAENGINCYFCVLILQLCVCVCVCAVLWSENVNVGTSTAMIKWEEKAE